MSWLEIFMLCSVIFGQLTMVPILLWQRSKCPTPAKKKATKR